MTKNHVLALDIAQNSALLQLRRADGTVLWSETLKATQTDWTKLVEVRKEKKVSWKKTFVVMEATGVYHHAWACRLRAEGAQVHVLNPLIASRMESIRNALRAHKTDPLDVERLAETAQVHAPKLTRFAYTAAAEQIGLRQLDHARSKLREVLTNIKKSLQSQLELTFPALLQVPIEPDSVRAVAILKEAMTAGEWLRLPEPRREKLAGTKKNALDQHCKETLADESIAQACTAAVKSLLQTQHALQEQLDHCDQQMAA